MDIEKDFDKYISIYEKLCPDDRISSDDPRREEIVAEMQAVHHAKTNKAASKVIEWWNAWPNPWCQSALEFAREARVLMSS